MRNPLVVCPSCNRHVRKAEASCPFCKRPVPADLVPVPQGPRRQLFVKATAYFASALAVSGCGARTELPVSSTGDAAPDATVDTGTEVDSTVPEDSEWDVAIDSGELDWGVPDDAPDDEGSPMPVYK